MNTQDRLILIFNLVIWSGHIYWVKILAVKPPNFYDQESRKCQVYFVGW